jgi:hypothetical protein
MRGLRLNGLLKLSAFCLASLAGSAVSNAQTWTVLPPPFQDFPTGIALQLTDGSIMVQEFGTANWYKLTPTKLNDYHNGTWTKLASIPASMNYVPLFFASAVLPDGRVIIEGGEYNEGKDAETNKGAIYDPVKDDWMEVDPPSGWTHIGDGQSVVLPDGTFMLGNCGEKGSICSPYYNQVALLDAKTLTWTVVATKNKFDSNSEEGWNLLPNGNVLTIDTYLGVPSDPTGTNSEIYDPTTEAWTSAGSTIAQLWDSRLTCGEKGATHEMGPAVLRPDGTVFATGANTCGAGHTAIYNTKTDNWTAGPDIPLGNDVADGPASILPDGNVLVDTSPGYGVSPSTLFEFNGTGWVTIPQPPGFSSSNTEGGRMLVTSTGGVLFQHLDTPEMWFYHAAGTYKPAWQPHICAACYPAIAYIGKTYKVEGTQFNGLTQGADFGDDAQSATNYPLVRIRNNKTGHYFYARTHSFSTMGVATGKKMVSAEFDVLPGTETGDSTMVVIANGIPSNTVGILLKPQP